MQAAVTAVEKKSKSALARTERLCEASVDSVRRGAATSLAAEARRLEGLLGEYTTCFAKEVSVPLSCKGEETAAPCDEVGSGSLHSHAAAWHPCALPPLQPSKGRALMHEKASAVHE